jgi:hypothetical protein
MHVSIDIYTTDLLGNVHEWVLFVAADDYTQAAGYAEAFLADHPLEAPVTRIEDMYISIDTASREHLAADPDARGVYAFRNPRLMERAKASRSLLGWLLGR